MVSGPYQSNMGCTSLFEMATKDNKVDRDSSGCSQGHRQKATGLYCWKKLDWGGGRTCHVHPDGSVLHGGSWPPPPRMRRLVNEPSLYALVIHQSRASTARQWRIGTERSESELMMDETASYP